MAKAAAEQAENPTALEDIIGQPVKGFKLPNGHPFVVPSPVPGHGLGIAVGSDENGTSYRDFTTGYGWTEPVSDEDRQRELATVSIEVSRSRMEALARRYGINPADYGSKEALHSAMLEAAKGMGGK